MRIAAFRYQDRACLGLVSSDGATVRPFLCDREDRADGLLGLISWLESGGELPPTGEPVALDGRDTRVRCWVNGELRQDGRTADMIFDIPTLIETVSRGITLYPGDIIATGTPARRPASAWACSRRATSRPATWCASRSMELELSRTTSTDMETLHYIGGRWQPAQDNRCFEVRDPADESLVAQVSEGAAADARLAADAAAAALPAWKARPARERCLILKKWHALIERDVEPLAQLISREQGKPLAEARGEIAYSAGYVEWFAEEGVRANGEVIAAPVNSKRYIVLREAVGVVAVVTPWNFPAAMIARKIAPALAAGCTVLAKPAEDTPLTALALVKLAEEAGVPPGVLNIVSASRERTPQVVGEWLADPRVRKISFTGSTPVGKLLARESAATLKKLSLELGGNAPFIVFEDADLDAAVEGLMAAKFRNGGQTCVSPNRVYVHAAVHDRFVDKLAARVGALRVGPASWPEAEIGPMINARAVDKIERHVNDAVAKGAKVVVGGQRVRNETARGPNYYAPTVLINARREMELSCEETFGPVVPVFRFADEAEVIAQANDTPYGLAGYFFSQDVKRIWRVASALETGMVGINEGAIAAQAAPFGGVKESGYGREGSHWGLDEYMHTKYLCQGGLL